MDVTESCTFMINIDSLWGGKKRPCFSSHVLFFLHLKGTQEKNDI